MDHQHAVVANEPRVVGIVHVHLAPWQVQAQRVGAFVRSGACLASLPTGGARRPVAVEVVVVVGSVTQLNLELFKFKFEVQVSLKERQQVKGCFERFVGL